MTKEKIFCSHRSSKMLHEGCMDLTRKRSDLVMAHRDISKLGRMEQVVSRGMHIAFQASHTEAG